MRIVDYPALSRGLAFEMLLGLVCLIYFGLAGPLMERYRLDRREIDDLRNALERFERIASERAARQSALAALEKQRSAQEGFLRGKNETLIAAEIQNRNKAIAATAHGELTSTQILPSETEGKLKRIRVREQMSISIRGVVLVFHLLESSTPFLFLDNVDIRSRPEPRRTSDPVVSSIVEVHFDAYGYVKEAP